MGTCGQLGSLVGELSKGTGTYPAVGNILSCTNKTMSTKPFRHLLFGRELAQQREQPLNPIFTVGTTAGAECNKHEFSASHVFTNPSC